VRRRRAVLEAVDVVLHSVNGVAGIEVVVAEELARRLEARAISRPPPFMYLSAAA
jgi:hypothetical protein